jgi:hypothetical protein
MKSVIPHTCGAAMRATAGVPYAHKSQELNTAHQAVTSAIHPLLSQLVFLLAQDL